MLLLKTSTKTELPEKPAACESTNHKVDPSDDDEDRLKRLFGPSKRSYDGRDDYTGANWSA